MIDSTPHPLLDDTAGSVSASPYGGGGRRAVMPETASNPLVGQSPASPYTAGFTEPLVRRAAPARPVASVPAPVEPVSLTSPVPAPSPPHGSDEDARLEEPSPEELSPPELSPTEPEPLGSSLVEVSPTEPEPLEWSLVEVSSTEPEPLEWSLAEVSPTEPEPLESSLAEVSPTEPEPLESSLAEVSPTEPEPLESSLAEVSPTEPEPLESSPTELDALEPTAPPSELAEPTADPGEGEPEPPVVEDDPEDDIEADADAEEPVAAVSAPSPVRSIPWISRTPEPTVTEDMPAAQAYTTPVDPGMWFIGPLEEAQAPPFVRVRHHGPERVDRGLVFASIPLILGCALAAALFHLGHIPSIVALAMAPAGALLYGKGAGSRPQAGAVRLVALLVVGVLLAWPISLATELSFYYMGTTGTSSGVIGYVVSSMFSTSLFMAKLKELLLVALFGLGGVIAVVQTMVSARLRRRSDAS